MITTKAHNIVLLLAILTVFQIHARLSAEERHRTHAHESNTQHNLALNDSEPWLTDESTTRVATQMQSTLKQFLTNYEDPTLEELQTLGKELKDYLDLLIRGCTMTGPAHDQLHHWLTKVIPDINHLRNTNKKSEGVRSVAHIDTLLNEYFTFFRAPE